MDLKGKVAVVTGGNGGLGQRICHALAAEGCHIAGVYAQSRDQAERIARECPPAPKVASIYLPPSLGLREETTSRSNTGRWRAGPPAGPVSGPLRSAIIPMLRKVSLKRRARA